MARLYATLFFLVRVHTHLKKIQASDQPPAWLFLLYEFYFIYVRVITELIGLNIVNLTGLVKFAS